MDKCNEPLCSGWRVGHDWTTVWQHDYMRYRYEDLDDKEFQQLIQSLLCHAYGPDVRAMPLGQADGGRDALHGSVIYQVKFTGYPDRVTDPVMWLLAALDGESDKIAALVERGAQAYCLVTNVAGTGRLDRGSIDRLDAELATRSRAWGIDLTRWWRDEVDAQLSAAPTGLKLSFLRVLPPDQVLGLAAQLPSEGRSLVPQAGRQTAGESVGLTGERGDLGSTPLQVAASVDAPFGRLPIAVRGRDTEVQRLLAPSQRRVQVLCGMGGLGKTTVSLQAAELARDDGCHVFWVNSVSASAVADSLQLVALAAGAPELAVSHAWSRPGRPAADLLWQHLAVWEQPWILIFDNADDLEVLSCADAALGDGTGWIRPPAGRGVAVVVTTRDRSRSVWGRRLAAVNDVAAVDDRAAARILLDMAPNAGDEREAQQLARRLGNLPLALQLAGSYLAAAHDDPLATARTFSSHDRLLSQAPLAIDEGAADGTADRRDEDEQARQTVAHTWDLSLQLLEARDTGPVRAGLGLLSCFAPNIPIPKGVVDPEHLVGAPIWSDSITSLRIKSALASLSRFGLLAVAAGGGEPAYQVHPLVAEATTAAMKHDEQLRIDTLTTAYALLVTETPEVGRDPKHWPHLATVVPHWPFMIRRLPLGLPDGVAELTLSRSCTAINYYRARADFRTAIRLAESALERSAATQASTIVSLGIRYHRALIHRDIGDLVEAAVEFRNISDEAKNLEGSRSLYLAARYEQASVSWRQGDYAGAESELREVLEAETAEYGATAHLTLLTRHDRAITLRALRRNTEARQEMEFVASNFAESIGPKHPDTLAARHELAVFLRDDGNLAAAEQAFRQVLADETGVLGEGHPSTLHTRASLATALSLQKRTAEAEHEYRVCLDGFKAALGPQHPYSLSVLHELIAIRMKSSAITPSDAERTLKWILKHQHRQLAPDHEQIMAARNDLAHILLMQDKIKTAAKEYNAVIDLLKKQNGPHHPRTLAVRVGRTSLQMRQGNYNEAVCELQEILRLQLGVLPRSHDEVLLTRYKLGEALLMIDKVDEAEAQLRAVEEAWSAFPQAVNDARLPQLRHDLALLDLRRGNYRRAALQLKKVVQNYADEQTGTLAVSTRNALALCLKSIGDLDGAEEHYRAALAIAKRVHDVNDAKVLHVRHNLAIVVRDLGRTGEAKKQLRALIKVERSTLQSDDPLLLASQYSLARTLSEAGNWIEAESEYRTLLSMQRDRFGDNHPDTLKTWTDLAHGMTFHADPNDAIVDCRSAYVAHVNALSEEDERALSVRHDLAIALARGGEYGQALTHLRTIFMTQRKYHQPTNALALRARCNMLLTIACEGKLNVAANGLSTLLQMVQEAAGGRGSRFESYILRGYARTLRELGQSSEAEAADNAVDSASRLLDAHPWVTYETARLSSEDA